MKINKLFVCLDLSDYDRECIKYAAFLVSKVNLISSVVLFHNIRFDFIDVVPDFKKTAVNDLKRKIAQKITDQYRHVFDSSGAVAEVIVDDNNNTNVSLENTIGDHKKTLVVMGLKKKEDGTGIVPMKHLAHTSLTNPVLLCPRKTLPRAASVLLAVDLSLKTDQVLDAGMFFARKLGSKITGVNVNALPVSYFPYIDFSSRMLREKLKAKAKKHFQSFLDNNKGIQADWDFELLTGDNIAANIFNYFEEHRGNLLIIGKTGETHTKRNRLGGTTNRILKVGFKKPILIV